MKDRPATSGLAPREPVQVSTLGTFSLDARVRIVCDTPKDVRPRRYSLHQDGHQVAAGLSWVMAMACAARLCAHLERLDTEAGRRRPG